MLESLLRTWAAGAAAAAAGAGPPPVLPAQIALEVHHQSDILTPWGRNANPGLRAGELGLAWAGLARMGYVPVSREDNHYCPHCSEFTVVRAFVEPPTGLLQRR